MNETFIPSVEFRSKFYSMTPADLYGKLKDKVYGQDEQLLEISLLVYAWMKSVNETLWDRQYNFICTGRSGCGKTTMVKALKDILSPIPVKIVDSSILTGAQFRGVSVNSIFDEEFVAWEGACVVVLDELDKMMSPMHSAYGENVSLEVQNQMLKIFDGSTIDEKTSAYVDTSKTLFIGLGAFESVCEALSPKKHTERKIGFDTPVADPVCEPLCEVNATISLDDIVEYGGGSTQLIGRFVRCINFKQPSSDVYKRLIFDTVMEIKGLYPDVHIDFLTDEVEDTIVKKAKDGRFGMRGLRSLIWDEFFRLYSVSIMEDAQKRMQVREKRKTRGAYQRLCSA